MVSERTLLHATVLGQPIPKSASRCCCQCMGSDADNAKAVAAIRSGFPALKEEVHTSMRPSVFSATVSETALRPKSSLEPSKQFVETTKIVEAAQGLAIPLNHAS